MRKLLLVVVLCFMFGVTYGFTSTQDPPAPAAAPGDLPPPVPPPGLPIDTDLMVLLFAGVVLGVFFLIQQKRVSS